MLAGAQVALWSHVGGKQVMNTQVLPSLTPLMSVTASVSRTLKNLETSNRINQRIDQLHHYR
jgi:hypothetical protein